MFMYYLYFKIVLLCASNSLLILMKSLKEHNTSYEEPHLQSLLENIDSVLQDAAVQIEM